MINHKSIADALIKAAHEADTLVSWTPQYNNYRNLPEEDKDIIAEMVVKGVATIPRTTCIDVIAYKLNRQRLVTEQKRSEKFQPIDMSFAIDEIDESIRHRRRNASTYRSLLDHVDWYIGKDSAERSNMKHLQDFYRSRSFGKYKISIFDGDVWKCNMNGCEFVIQDVAKRWTSEEQSRFDVIVRTRDLEDCIGSISIDIATFRKDFSLVIPNLDYLLSWYYVQDQCNCTDYY